MRFLAENSGHRKWLLKNPARRPFAIEEIMRRYGVANLTRTVVGDIELGGTMVRAGEHISLVTCMHGLDAREYDDPESVDFERETSKASATFGYGPHRCPGNGLARMEMRVMVDEWMRRIPEFGVD